MLNTDLLSTDLYKSAATGTAAPPLTTAPAATLALYSGRKCWIDDSTGLVANSPRAQRHLPVMLLAMLSSSLISPSVPWPW